MVLADVGLGQIIWTTLFILMLVLFIGLIIFVVRDLIRDHKLSGWTKAGWLVAVVIFPILGSLVYLIARGGGTRGEAFFEDSAARSRRTRTEVERQARRDADSTGTGPVED
jgi:hypothetical protein